ncbi:DNA-processing protein DprA, partial [Pseudomonas aeruginosa]|nr:DNA-processing protein DprA [Pseudomonas aeruginosa]
RSTGESSAGLDALRKKGALPWPNPQDVDTFAEVFNVQMPTVTDSPQVGLSLLDGSPAAVTTAPIPPDAASLPTTESEPAVSNAQPSAATSDELPIATSEALAPAGETKESP